MRKRKTFNPDSILDGIIDGLSGCLRKLTATGDTIVLNRDLLLLGNDPEPEEFKPLDPVAEFLRKLEERDEMEDSGRYQGLGLTW